MCRLKNKWKLVIPILFLISTGSPTVVYGFSAVAPSGQTLYYDIMYNNCVWVSGYSNNDYYNGYTEAKGDLTIPASVVYNGTTYIVTGIWFDAFHNCDSLTSVIIPNTVTSIGANAFKGCTELISISIPDSVTNIGASVFLGCTGLMNIVVSEGNPVYDSRNNCNALIETATNTLIQGCQNTIIPNSIISIGEGAFYGCTSLSSINIPNSVTKIRVNAFRDCTSLTSISIPNSVVGVEGIEPYAFQGCTGLLSVAFYNSGTGNYTFRGCTGLTAIYFSDSVTDIGHSSFSGCTNLLSVTIPNSVNNIYSNAFYGCSGLTSITIGNSVANIQGSVFANCTNLDTVYMKPLIPPTIGTNTFSNNSSTRVFLLEGCSYNSYYNHSNWVQYRDYLRDPVYDISINVHSNDVIRGSAIVVAGRSNRDVRCDSTAVILANANYGYHFEHWSNGRNINPDTVSLTGDSTLVAFFLPNLYIITGVSSDSTRGLVTGSDTVEYLDTVTLTAVPKYGYVFNQWSDGYYVNPRHIVATANMTKVANFAPMPVSISLSVDSSIHGMCYNQGATTYLGTAIIQAVANYGYHFVQWSDGVTDNPRYVTLTQDTAFVASFAKNTYSITVNSTDSVMGMGNNIGEVEYLDGIFIIATPNYGYHFTQWNDGDTNNPRYVVVTRDSTFVAQFDYNQYSISLDAENNTYGTVGGAGSYNYLTEQAITATPNHGYHFSMWNDGDTNNPRIITLTQDTSFTAFFVPNQYTLTVIAMEHGTTSGSGNYDYGDTVIIQAFPDEHYHFTRWNDNNTDNPRECRIEEDKTYSAFFAIDTHSVQVTSNDIVRGMVESNGTQFVYGTPCTVTATAYTGYTFVGWSNGVTANPYTFAVISDVELMALFVEEGEEVYTVTVESADPTMGSVSGGGQALYGGTLTIRAIPNEGYQFLNWQDGNTENPRTVTVTGNITYTAYFESTQGIENIDVTEIKIYATEGRIVVQGADGLDMRVFDITGREMIRATRNGETPLLPNGVYLVKVGTLPARKVVVLR